jgi:hypothetical protein
MDLDLIRRETESAVAEAGADVDLSYLTQEFVEIGLRDARDIADITDAERADLLPESEGRVVYNYLHSCWFQGGPGSRVYGYLASAGGSCNRSWYTYFTWRTRSVHRRCATGSATIWKVGS